jgi:hypothetical protein
MALGARSLISVLSLISIDTAIDVAAFEVHPYKGLGPPLRGSAMFFFTD